MAVPKKRKSRARRDMRRAQHMKLDTPDLSICPQCRRLKLPHRVCLHCGFYKGVEVVDVLARQRKSQQAKA
jgi:large subunit ribosomal protein L32